MIYCQLIQDKQQHARFASNLRALEFQLRIIFQSRFLSDKYSKPLVEEKTSGSNRILKFVLYIDCSIFSYIRLVKSEKFHQPALSTYAKLNKHYIITAQTFNDPSGVISRVEWNSCSTINRSTD